MKNSSGNSLSKLVAFAQNLIKGGGTVEFEDHSAYPFHWRKGDILGDFANELTTDMSTEEQSAWSSLLHFLQKSSGNKPSKSFLKELDRLLESWPGDFLPEKATRIFLHIINHKEAAAENASGRRPTFLYEYNASALKGLVWASLFFLDANLIAVLARLAERSFKKIPGRGYAARSVGHAVLWVLAESSETEAIGQLSKLKSKSLQANTRTLIDNYLNDIARKSGMSISDLEDISVPDFGLDARGQLEHYFDDYHAVLKLEKIGRTSVQWFRPDGSPQKSVPAFVKDQYPQELKELLALAKDIASSSTAQRDRLDRTLRIERQLSYATFEKTILKHSLLGWIARRLIWTITSKDRQTNAFFTGRQWRDSFGNTIDWVDEHCKIQLWHPAGTPVEETLRWRSFLEDIQLVQPMKQAFREIYLLTDAEINTRTYSNRFAAHILKQHQFAALARLRGWQYKLLGAFDDGLDSSMATLELPEKSLRAEYWVSEVNAQDSWTASGIWSYVATDQVRFYKNGSQKPMNLMDVPVVVLSEVLRDADLFVGVASVGNDPVWQDSGGLPAHRDYWESYSFGALSEMAKSRREILTRLLPRLKIAKIAEIRDRFLVVRGKIRTYKIHLGSGNILMEPNDQYLCIVPDRKQGSATSQNNVFLPFEGDAGLSLILSKAFMLAEDDKIEDSTITRQIGK